MEKTGTVSVLVVNDQSLQRLALRMLLAAEPGLTVVGEAADGDEAIRASAALRPDVVLMDSQASDAIDTIRRIAHPAARTRTPSAGFTGEAAAGSRVPRILMLTAAEQEADARAALRAGAGGFLLNDADPAELTAAVRVVAAGDAVITPGLTRALIDAVRQQHTVRPLPRTSGLGALTGRERDVLIAVASGWTNAEIAQWLSIAPTTVKTHVSNVLAKIGARARVQAVTFAYESGLIRPAA
ncbi:response regulator transcription factor [Streptomyces sp. Ag109_O5-10]|uniref:LuxR C-terminal-related transcriptional regulator n=1 Tax=Streptomyces sp. Ag109_O5-10 TaxID=1855349 RepID=UPI000895AEE4|nr:response regulator transcription factor [Streptomyces sp. Ag109_O5-10]SEE47776.1 DNA-binding response regulator, NarL/FixJ family, contains REC and HTH domains [Streptomyces sp. Ag109_O5-10]